MKVLKEYYDSKKEYRFAGKNGYRNRWTIIDDMTVDGVHYGLFENCVYGDETCYLVADIDSAKDKTFKTKDGGSVTLPTIDCDTTEVYETFDDIQTCLEDEEVITESINEATMIDCSDMPPLEVPEKDSSKSNAIYNHPTDDEIEDMLSKADYDGYQVTVDGHTFDIHSDVRNGKTFYDFWCPEFFFYAMNKEKAMSTLKNIDDAIQSDRDKEKDFAKKALPKLWDAYKNGSWMTEDGYVDDWFSDYYKDVFGHHPRREYQIEHDMQEYAKELGISL